MSFQIRCLCASSSKNRVIQPPWYVGSCSVYANLCPLKVYRKNAIRSAGKYKRKFKANYYSNTRTAEHTKLDKCIYFNSKNANPGKECLVEMV